MEESQKPAAVPESGLGARNMGFFEKLEELKNRAGLGSRQACQGRFSDRRFGQARKSVELERGPPALTDRMACVQAPVKQEVVEVESQSESGRRRKRRRTLAKDSLEDRIVARSLELRRSGSEEMSRKKKKKGKKKGKKKKKKRDKGEDSSDSSRSTRSSSATSDEKELGQ